MAVPKAATSDPAKRNRRKRGDTPRNDFERLQDALGWSNRFTAQEIGCTPALVDRWASNGNAPPRVMDRMEALVAFKKSLPPLTDWKRGWKRLAK